MTNAYPTRRAHPATARRVAAQLARERQELLVSRLLMALLVAMALGSLGLLYSRLM